MLCVFNLLFFFFFFSPVGKLFPPGRLNFDNLLPSWMGIYEERNITESFYTGIIFSHYIYKEDMKVLGPFYGVSIVIVAIVFSPERENKRNFAIYYLIFIRTHNGLYISRETALENTIPVTRF